MVLLLLAVAISSSLSFASHAVSESNTITCEVKFKDARKVIYNETSLNDEIKNLTKIYSDWGELLDSAPLVISGMGKLIVRSNQKTELPIDINLKIFPKKFNYPKSFRSSLLQISQKGNLAFLKAQRNMEKIRMCNSLSSHFRDIVMYLVSKKKSYVVQYPRKSMSTIKEVADKSKELSAEVVKEFKSVVESINEMIVTCKQMEQRRRRTQQVAERKKSLAFTKMYYMEAIKSMQIASNELEKLKTALTQLIEFYSKMSIFISKAAEQSEAFVEFVLRDRNKLDDDETFAAILDSVQKANEASFLVHGVSDMCIDVSEMYVIEQTVNLDRMMKANASEVDLDRFQLELTWSTESDSEGIRHFIKADETLLGNNLVDRHNQIANEYKWMVDCLSPDDLDYQNKQ